MLMKLCNTIGINMNAICKDILRVMVLGMVMIATVKAYGQTCQGSLQILVYGTTTPLTPFQTACNNQEIQYFFQGSAFSNPSWNVVPSSAGDVEIINSGQGAKVRWRSSGVLRVDYPDANLVSQCVQISYTISISEVGNIVGNNQVCYNGSTQLSLSGAQNASSATWWKCENGCSSESNWLLIADATGTIHLASTLQTDTRFRARLEYNGSCGSGVDVTNEFLVEVNSTEPLNILINDIGTPCPSSAANITFWVLESSVLGKNPSFVWYRNGTSSENPGGIGDSNPDPKIYDPADPNYTFQSGDNVKVVVTSGPGCVAESEVVQINFNSEIFPLLNDIVPVNPICEGGDVTFTVSIVGTSQNVSGSWHVGSGGFPFTGQTYPLQVNDVNGETISFTTTLAGSCGTPKQYQRNLLIDASPTPVASAENVEVCTGDTTSILLTTNGIPSTFSWTFASSNVSSSSSAGTSSTIAETLNAISGVSGTAIFTVTPKSNEGCVGEPVNVEVLVRTRPLNPILTNTQFCDFEQLALIGEPSENISDYNWFDDQGVLIGTGMRKDLDVRKTGSYSFEYQAIGGAGCANIERSTVTLVVSSSCDHKMNSIESISYSVDGGGTKTIVGRTKKYFDYAASSLQEQTWSLSKDKILSSTFSRDRNGRSALSTLAAPTAHAGFQYTHWFATDANGHLLDYSNLGQPLGSQTGTIGWYYSNSNALEQNVPVTSYPFSQVQYYTDGTNEQARFGAAGDVLRIGGERELATGQFPVFHELDQYVFLRTKAIEGIVQDGSLQNDAQQTIVRDQNGKYTLNVTDRAGRTLMSAAGATNETVDLEVINHVASKSDATDADYRPLTYFYLLRDETVTITGSADYTVEEILEGHVFTPVGNVWPAGFYRIILHSGDFELEYRNQFVDVSYQFYDDAGRSVCSVSPNGVRQFKQGVDFTNIDKSTYQYNFRGWLLTSVEPDAGETRYVYREDGKIRFSENALQRDANLFSYTHYDEIGRPVESGEYVGNLIDFVKMDHAAFSTSDMQGELEKVYKDVAWGESDRTDWVITYYDATPSGGIPLPLQQEFIRGAVASTENANNQTWYSYDEFGRVKWMLQQPKSVDITTLLRYSYDFSGNVLQVENATYRSGTLTAQFFHHYEYDLDSRLIKAYTSTDGTTKMLRASYEYYLHGPLKRIEIGNKLQGVDFVYNINGWLTHINHPDTDQDPGRDGIAGTHADVRKDVFGMVLDYYESSMSNLHVTSTGSAIQNLNVVHGLPGRKDIAFHQPLIRFRNVEHSAQTSPMRGQFKEFSAENVRIAELIPQDEYNNER